MTATSPRTRACAPRIPAIRMALDAGAAVMVTSHLGRPTEGEFKPEDSLSPVARRLSDLLGIEVRLVSGWVDGGFAVGPGEVVLLENCRLNVGEKKNKPELAAKLGKLCDIFVHDAFGTAHRAEGTTYGIAETAPIACAGPLLAAEMDAISKALANPKRPLVAIVAGSKVSHQADHPAGPGQERRRPDRRRRHRQHLHAGRGPEDRQEPGRARPAGRSHGGDRSHEGARRRGADPRGRGLRQGLRRGCTKRRSKPPPRWPTTT